jgi:hypothetical protein
VILPDISSLREYSLDRVLNEVRALKESMKLILLSYMTSLKELSKLPNEFDRRFWVCCVENLVQKVTADYQQYQAQVWKLDMVSKLMTLG